MSLNKYRATVIQAVECDFCGSPRNAPCYRVNKSKGTHDVTNEQAAYVHDDRSLAYENSKTP